MKRTQEPQINSRRYWNYIYTTPAKMVEYWSPSQRFGRALDLIKDGDKVIDLGCGVGVLPRMIQEKRKGCEVWGLDISDEVIRNDQVEDPDTKYMVGEVGYNSDLPDNYFNVVFCGETIEHMDYPEKLFQEAFRILKKGGILIVTTPKEDRVRSSEHVWYFEDEDVKKFYRDAGFNGPKLLDLDGMEYMVVFFALGEKP